MLACIVQVVPILLSVIHKISAIRLYLPSDLRSRDNRLSVLKSIQEVEKRFPDGLPLLDPIQDMGIKDAQLKEIVQKVEAFENRYMVEMGDIKILMSMRSQYAKP